MAETALAPRKNGLARVKRQSPKDTLGVLANYGVRLQREAIERGMSLSQLLENMDPTEDYPVEERSMDAYERLLSTAGIITHPIPEYGVQSSTWEECTTTPEIRALMPEFMARIWRRTGNLSHLQQQEIVNMTQASDFDAAKADVQTRAVLLSGDVS